MIPLMIDDQYPKMPWDKIDTVVFDVGQVLLRFDPPAILEKEFPDDPYLRERLLLKMFHSPYWVMMDHGIINNEEAAIAMTGLDKALQPAIEQVLKNWIDLKDVVPEGLEMLYACKSHGKRIYALTNYMSDPFSHAIQQHAFFNLFEDIIVSAQIGLIKPNPVIYQYATERFKLDPSRTLFIDDSPANIESALLHGWQGFCLNRPGKLHDFIAE